MTFLAYSYLASFVVALVLAGTDIAESSSNATLIAVMVISGVALSIVVIA